jgi:hypothetical protein
MFTCGHLIADLASLDHISIYLGHSAAKIIT